MSAGISESCATRFVAFCLRKAPKRTNSVADGFGRFVGPIVKRTIGRNYRLGVTRHDAGIYNYKLGHLTPEQRAERDSALKAFAEEFWAGLREYLPTRGEQVDSVRCAFVGNTPPNQSDRKNQIEEYLRHRLHTIGQRRYGAEFIAEIPSMSREDLRMPDDIHAALCGANLATWFLGNNEKPGALRSVAYSESYAAKPFWKF